MKLVLAGLIGMGLLVFWLFMEFWGGLMNRTRDLQPSSSRGRQTTLRAEMGVARVAGAAGLVLVLVGFFG